MTKEQRKNKVRHNPSLEDKSHHSGGFLVIEILDFEASCIDCGYGMESLVIYTPKRDLTVKMTQGVKFHLNFSQSNPL